MTSVATAGSQAVGGTPAASRPKVNVKTARRRLASYTALADLSKDLDRLEAAHRAGTLKRLGNHEAGPLFAHLAVAMKYSFDGFPTRAPAWIRWLGPLMKKRILSKSFEPGFNLNKEAESVAWDDSVPFEEGLAQLREQITRAHKHPAPPSGPNAPHPFFGPMSTPEWQTYHLRHSELHLSFLQL